MRPKSSNLRKLSGSTISDQNGSKLMMAGIFQLKTEKLNLENSLKRGITEADSLEREYYQLVELKII